MRTTCPRLVGSLMAVAVVLTGSPLGAADLQVGSEIATGLSGTPAVGVDKTSGAIHVAVASGGKVVLKRFDRQGKELTVTGGTSPGFGATLVWDLQVDGQGNTHFVADVGTPKLYYIGHKADGTWSKALSLETEKVERAYVANLAVDASGNVHAVWWSQPRRGVYGIKYKKVTDPFGAQTAKEIILISHSEKGETPDIAISPQGKMVVCHKGTGSKWVPTVRPWNGSSFGKVQVTGYLGNHTGEVTGIAAGPDGRFHMIASTGPSGSSDYGLMVASSTDYKAATVSADTNTSEGNGCDIAVDGNGTLYATYVRGAMYAYTNDGSGWQPKGNEGIKVTGSANGKRAHAKIAAHENWAVVAYSSGGAKIRILSVGKPAQTNQPPTASIAASTTTASLGVPLAFDGSGSLDQDGFIQSYAWNFGDGATASGTAATHTWSAPGTYTVTLTVTDDRGSSSASTVRVTIDPAPDTQPPGIVPTAMVVGGRVDDLSVTSLQVGSQKVGVIQGGFSATVALSGGAFSISFGATDAPGNTAARTLNVVVP